MTKITGTDVVGHRSEIEVKLVYDRKRDRAVVVLYQRISYRGGEISANMNFDMDTAEELQFALEELVGEYKR